MNDVSTIDGTGLARAEAGTAREAAPAGGSRGRALRELLCSSRLEFFMGVQNALSAKVAEEAGFPGLWASGLGISAQFGVRDSNEASWTQVVETLEFMVDATRVPILLDGDTGYGNFNSMRRLVRKLEQRGVAGVCIEDKEFPKKNSFLEGERQPLADVEEFCGKIRAGQDSRSDPDFCLVARVEALIAGWGVEEALRRAEAYHAAGADAILIHSKRPDPGEILEFAAEWGGRSPLVIVPTTYYSTPAEVYEKAGISVAIWANHLLRASVAAMQETARAVRAAESPVDVEDRIVPVAEIFRLQGAGELLEAERRYTRSARARTGALVLAATRGPGLEAVTEDRPKVMLPVAGRPLLRRLVDEFKRHGVDEITVVAGYKPEAIDVRGVRIVENPEHASTGELASLACALDALGEDAVVLYGDLLFRSYVLRDLLEAPGEIVAVVDSAPQREARDLAYCTAPDDRALFRQEVELRRVGAGPETGGEAPDGRWIGMLRVRDRGGDWLREALGELRGLDRFPRLGMPDLLNRIVAAGHPVKVQYIHGHWLDVNDLEDLRRATDFAHGRQS
ncbi:MAG: phosphoenolpyruvate mutase [Gemmatimonadota bacterium]